MTMRDFVYSRLTDVVKGRPSGANPKPPAIWNEVCYKIWSVESSISKAC